MTGQDLLDRLEDRAREFQLQPNEADVTRGLRALNTAQDYFEVLAANVPNLSGSHTGTVTTAASTESTSFPSGLIRLDKLQFIDPDTSRPTYSLDRIDDVGGHVKTLPWPLYQRLATPTGKPRGYYTNGTSIYWEPLPDATHTLRWYGFQHQADLTAAGTFTYDDAVALPLTIFAAAVLRLGLDDPVTDYMDFAEQLFAPVLRMLKKVSRERAPSRQYAYDHDT